MADIEKKNGGPQHTTEWDPLRAMREMFRWDPFRAMAPMLTAMPGTLEWQPSFDVTETVDAYVFKADIPGVKKDDLEITATGNRIEISGKRDVETETKHEKLYAYERQFGTFSRTFTLPDGVDIAHARSELKDGVLTLAIPKLIGAYATKIPIATGGPRS